MRSRGAHATLSVEYMDLSKRGLLSSYDLFVVRILAKLDSGRTVIVREDQFDERQKARDCFSRYKEAIL